MLIFKLVENTLVDGNIHSDKVLQHFVQERGVICQNEKTQIKKFLEQLTELDIESETDYSPTVSLLSKEHAVVYQDIYYETNDNGEEFTVQIQLTIKKVNLKKEIKFWIEKNMLDYTKQHLEIWSDRYADYKTSQLKYDLSVNNDFSGDFETLALELDLPELFQFNDNLQNYFIQQFIKYAVKNFKR